MTHKLNSTADRVIQRPTVRATLKKIIRSVTSDPNLLEDLLQDALLYLWKQLQRPPFHRFSWYLQRCRFRLKDELRRGCSLDALKRRNLATTLSVADDDEADPVPSALLSREDVLSPIITRDIFEKLSARLKPANREVLCALAEGSGIQQVAKQLGISHPAVIKRRRKIAAAARRIGISL